jgi:hypothetical protein
MWCRCLQPRVPSFRKDPYLSSLSKLWSSTVVVCKLYIFG